MSSLARAPVSAVAPILVASANADLRRKIVALLHAQHCCAEELPGGAAALARLEVSEPRALLLDSGLPDLDAEEVAGLVRARFPRVRVVLVDSAAGQDGDAAKQALDHALRALGMEAAAPRAGENSPQIIPFRREGLAEPLPGMTGTSPQMLQVYRLARLVGPRDTAVLINGETGTGKELVAEAIHALSPRARKPFVVVNCAAIPEMLLESELFGYVRGAFTGAMQSRLGRTHAAHGGTLFLDEVGELPLSMQAKLLRFLQDGEVQRLGSPDVFRVDVRVIAATNAELEKRARDGRFRLDLFYRLAVFPVALPPLRARPGDIEALARRFLRELCAQAGLPPRGIAPATMQLLLRRAWPGNVRELKHTIERAFILSEAEPELLPEHLVPFFSEPS